MAAHGLTVLRNAARLNGPEQRSYLQSALAAPATSLSNGFPSQLYFQLDTAVAHGEDPTEILSAGIQLIQWMDQYRTLEDLQRARDNFARPGKPYYRRRLAQFFREEED